MNQKTISLVYIFCAAQFAGILVYVSFFCRPMTRMHLALVMFSVIFGLIVTGNARRSYDSGKTNTQDEAFRALDEKLKKIRNKDNSTG